MGMLASASIGDSVGLYEPIHGSAHDITGKGIANPLASVLSVALMLDISFSMKKEAEEVIGAVEQILKQGYRTIDIADEKTDKTKILNTGAMGTKVVEQIKSKKAIDTTALNTASFIASVG
jgi:3-isopropylmalate dehydrogenase